MSKLIFCSKLNHEAEQMNAAPFPGPFGERIHQHISKNIWTLIIWIVFASKIKALSQIQCW